MRPSPLPVGLLAATLALLAPLLVRTADAGEGSVLRSRLPTTAAPLDAPGSRSETVLLVQDDTPLGAVERAYQLTVPAAGAGLRPLVIALHGRQQGIDRLRELSGLEALGDTEGFVSAFPVGWAGVWNAGTCCATTGAPSMPDVAFLDQVVSDVAARTPIDPARVHVVGFSNGGMMAYRYACQRSSAVAGVAVVSGSMAASPDYADSGPQRCRPAAPVSVVAVHGSHDRTVPYEGGPVAGNRDSVIAPVRGGVDQSAVGAGCRTGRSYRVGTSVRLDYGACEAGAAVRLVRLQGHGHGWTRDSRTYGYDTTAGIWGFLRDRRAAAPAVAAPVDSPAAASTPDSPAAVAVP